MVIAVDFDGCLCESRWPDIGKPRREVIEYLLERQRSGDKLILWTCREGELLDRALMWCLRQGIRFDAVNANLPERIEEYGNDCRKVGADEYWDDKSVIVMGTRAGGSEIITPEMSIVLSMRSKPEKTGWLEKLKGWVKWPFG